jgi:hypothetical protein
LDCCVPTNRTLGWLVYSPEGIVSQRHQQLIRTVRIEAFGLAEIEPRHRLTFPQDHTLTILCDNKSQMLLFFPPKMCSPQSCDGCYGCDGKVPPVAEPDLSWGRTHFAVTSITAITKPTSLSKRRHYDPINDRVRRETSSDVTCLTHRHCGCAPVAWVGTGGLRRLARSQSVAQAAPACPLSERCAGSLVS